MYTKSYTEFKSRATKYWVWSPYASNINKFYYLIDFPLQTYTEALL